MKKFAACLFACALLAPIGSLQAANTDADITAFIQAILAEKSGDIRAILTMHPDIMDDAAREIHSGTYTQTEIDTVTDWLDASHTEAKSKKDSDTAGCSQPSQLLNTDELPRGSHRYH